MNLKGKVAIVTGAGKEKGIGRATALKLAEYGANVVVTDIATKRDELVMEKFKLNIGDDFSALEKLVTEIEAYGVKGMAIRVDVTDRKQIEACVKKVCEVFGGVDILFNNAGTAVGSDGYLLEQNDRQWDLSYKVNLKGTADFCKAVIPSMIERGGGSIINNSSISGLRVTLGMAGYSSTKFATVGLTKSIAIEYGEKNIRCNAVCPGNIATSMADALIDYVAEMENCTPEEAKSIITQNVSLKRYAEPEEVAEVVAFLASDKASYVTGVALPVCGGMNEGL